MKNRPSWKVYATKNGEGIQGHNKWKDKIKNSFIINILGKMLELVYRGDGIQTPYHQRSKESKKKSKGQR